MHLSYPHYTVGNKLTNTLSWIAVGPAGVFGTKNNTCYYLENSRGVVRPSDELLRQQTWTNVSEEVDYCVEKSTTAKLLFLQKDDLSTYIFFLVRLVGTYTE